MNIFKKIKKEKLSTKISILNYKIDSLVDDIKSLKKDNEFNILYNIIETFNNKHNTDFTISKKLEDGYVLNKIDYRIIYSIRKYGYFNCHGEGDVIYLGKHFEGIDQPKLCYTSKGSIGIIFDNDTKILTYDNQSYKISENDNIYKMVLSNSFIGGLHFSGISIGDIFTTDYNSSNYCIKINKNQYVKITKDNLIDVVSYDSKYTPYSSGNYYKLTDYKEL